MTFYPLAPNVSLDKARRSTVANLNNDRKCWAIFLRGRRLARSVRLQLDLKRLDVEAADHHPETPGSTAADLEADAAGEATFCSVSHARPVARQRRN